MLQLYCFMLKIEEKNLQLGYIKDKYVCFIMLNTIIQYKLNSYNMDCLEQVFLSIVQTNLALVLF